MLTYSEVQKTLQENSTGKPLTNKEITDIMDKVGRSDQVLGQTSLLMLKHELNGFLDSLKSEGKLLAIGHIYEQLAVRPGLDLYYLRPKLEEIFREGLGTSPSNYLNLLNLPKLFEDLTEWNTVGVHLILEKCLELNNQDDLLRVLNKCISKLSTIKVVDLLKKIMILEKTELAEQILEVTLSSGNHSKSSIDLTRLPRDIHIVEGFFNQEQGGGRYSRTTKG